MSAIKEHELLVRPVVLLEKLLGVVEVDHFVPSGSQEHDPAMGVEVYLREHIELFRMDPRFALHVTAHRHEDTRKDAVEEALAKARHYLLRYLLADRFQVREGRVHDQQVALFAQQRTDCSHAPAPDCHLEILFLQEPHCLVDLKGLLFAQRYVVLLAAVAAPCEIEAGKGYVRGEVLKLRVALVPAGGIAVEVEDEIAGALGGEDGEGKGDAVDVVLVPALVLAPRVEDLLVVGEPGGPNEHEAVFLDAGFGDVPLHFVGAGPARRIIVIHIGHYKPY